LAASLTELDKEILQLLAQHSQETVDGVGLFILLNTVAGGHYEERYSEASLTRELRNLLAGSLVTAHDSSGAAAGPDSPDLMHCTFALTAGGMEALPT
jgi:hypothetical protein